MAFQLRSGFDAVEEIGREIEQRKALAASGSGNLFRFFMKAGEEKKITFLTTEPPVIKEHGLKINGKWGNHFTCLSAIDQECPICKSGDRPSDVGFFLIIDHTPFTIKSGKNAGQQREFSVKLFVAKYKVLAQLKKFAVKYAHKGGLVGKTFEVSRSADTNAPNTGDLFVPDSEYTEAELVSMLNAQRASVQTQDGKPLKPYASLADAVPKWAEMLAPKSAETIASVLSGKAEESTDEDSAEVSFA